MKRQPSAPTERYELWQDATGYVLMSATHSQKETLLEQPARLLTILDAVSWEDAQRQRDRYVYGSDPRDAL